MEKWNWDGDCEKCIHYFTCDCDQESGKNQQKESALCGNL